MDPPSGFKHSTKTVLIIGLALVQIAHSWVNDWDQPADFECLSKEAISRIESIHSNAKEDRRWKFECQDVKVVNNDCYTTEYINAYHELIAFECDYQKAIVGIDSIHHNGNKDRQFKIKCCKVPSFSYQSCYITGYINAFDGVMDKAIGSKEVFAGLYSFYNGGKGDRRWKVKICTIKG
ncbi:hemagglutinin/amebocyte aggregation factor-like [Gigantopelta aegis]|uniref:hemagglutinin/amebocyte aggregation factor-like n=1 Tax=Gigantopelta aegis TaxID=1735272 RepID=UPI001B88C8C0|nr:hemagglutinin/amebocyte aggregation factor-like [Gigantopelta aegis]